MSLIRERFIEALDFIALKNPDLEERTGIKATDWGNLRNRKIRVNDSHIEGLKIVGPEFVYWVMTGETIPDKGQTSPEEEKVRINLRKAG